MLQFGNTMSHHEGVNPTNVDGSDSELMAHARSESSWPQSRIELLHWFRQQAPSVADAYRGAVKLLEDVAFPGRLHFIAHAVRDISDRLVFILDPQQAPSRVHYESHLDKIARDWPMGDGFCQSGGPPVVETYPIPVKVARRIDVLVGEHRLRRSRPSAHKILFEILARAEAPGADVNERIVKAFQDVREWFMDRAHLRTDGVPAVDEAELRRQFEAFENILHSFVGSFFTGTKELDAILQSANARAS